MKYTKKHRSDKALKLHAQKIKARGGAVIITGLILNYSFPTNEPFCPICKKPEKNKESRNRKVCKKCQNIWDRK